MRGRKVKTWAKGHSSDSNPKISKYRDMAAKSRFVINEKTPKKVRFEDSKDILTKNENLLEKLTLNDENLDDLDEEKSSIRSRAETNFTTFTNCTNPTFNKVHRLWTSGSDLQNEVLTVLAAVTDVLKSNNEPETEICYFGALSAFLADEKNQKTSTAAATTYLLSLVMKKISGNVLQTIFAKLSPIFCRNLQPNNFEEEEEKNALQKYTIECLTILLKIQNLENWENSSLQQILRQLLHFTLDGRPKLRKIAQKMIVEILETSKNHPASKICAEFCLEILSKNENDDYAILHFLQQCMHLFNENQFKICAEKILNNSKMDTSLQFFEKIFYNRPKISRQLVLQLIQVFYDLQPCWKNEEYSTWCKVQTNLHICLESCDIWSKFCQILLENLPNLQEKLAISTSVKSIKIIFEHFLPDSKDGGNLVNCLQNCLNLKYMQIWPQFMDILGHFFQFYPKNLGVNLEILFKNLAQLREMDENSAFLNHLNRCFASAIKYLGPEIILRAIKINLDFTKLDQTPNLWLLPLLRQNIERSNLGHFNSEFLPKILAISDGFNAKNEKILQILESQIWELLPSYCQFPQDFDENLPKIGPLLVKFLLEKPNLRLIILKSIRNLILKSSTNNPMANYAEHFLPIIINLFINSNELMDGYDSKMVRQSCLETLKIYLKITPENLITKFLNLTIEKFEHFSTNDQKHRCLDVQIALCPHLISSQMTALLEFLKQFFQNFKDKSLQKKAYRALEECLGAELEHSSCFFKQNKDQILDILLSKNQNFSSTKASKIRCLKKLTDLNFLNLNFQLEILPDIILNLRELNIKTRRSAAIFFCQLINSNLENHQLIWRKLSHLFDSQNLDHVTCLLIAARLFIFEMKHQIEGSILSEILSKIQLLLENSNRQIVKSSLEFLKTFIVYGSSVQLGQYLDNFLPAIYRQTEDCRRHFRFLIKKILAKLMRRLPYELICKFLPDDESKKQLNNVRKALQRYERRKMAARQGAAALDDENDRDDDVLSGVTGLSRPETIADLLKNDDSAADDDDDSAEDDDYADQKKTPPAIFLHEKSDEILDFTDLKSVSKMTSRKKIGKNASKMDKNRGFQTDSSGRLIITNGENEQKIEEKSKIVKLKGKRKNVDDFDEIFDSDDDISIKKRPKSSEDILPNREPDSDLDEALHYKPGGRGIHRNLSKEKLPQSGGQSRKPTSSSCKNGLQPYAYVPLDFKQLNKRKRSKASGEFRNLLEGAKKGSKKASRGKKR
uniref:Ribosomal RNA-processing protein 12-like conserved domain-containing protein n=1 Tax=Romanomermis culicivorax TaxID=13658 RepID=A0A915IIM5_ROMCU